MAKCNALFFVIKYLSSVTRRTVVISSRMSFHQSQWLKQLLLMRSWKKLNAMLLNYMEQNAFSHVRSRQKHKKDLKINDTFKSWPVAWKVGLRIFLNLLHLYYYGHYSHHRPDWKRYTHMPLIVTTPYLDKMPLILTRFLKICQDKGHLSIGMTPYLYQILKASVST